MLDFAFLVCLQENKYLRKQAHKNRKQIAVSSYEPSDYVDRTLTWVVWSESCRHHWPFIYSLKIRVFKFQYTKHPQSWKCLISIVTAFSLATTVWKNCKLLKNIKSCDLFLLPLNSTLLNSNLALSFWPSTIFPMQRRGKKLSFSVFWRLLRGSKDTKIITLQQKLQHIQSTWKREPFKHFKLNYKNTGVIVYSHLNPGWNNIKNPEQPFGLNLDGLKCCFESLKGFKKKKKKKRKNKVLLIGDHTQRQTMSWCVLITESRSMCVCGLSKC